MSPRDRRNPLFPVNLADLLIRHGGANHKRETIAFSKRRQGSVERLAILQVWRNFMKPFSEKRRDGSPAERLGLMEGKLRVEGLLRERLFPSLIELPERLMRYYRREVETRQIRNCRRHRLGDAFQLREGGAGRCLPGAQPLTDAIFETQDKVKGARRHRRTGRLRAARHLPNLPPELESGETETDQLDLCTGKH